MDKRAQFFLVAALIISGIVLSLAAVYNSTKVQKEDTQFYDLSSEIGAESSKVIDYGVYNSADTTKIIQNFTSVYADEIGNLGNETLIFLYGDSTNVAYTLYQPQNQGSVGFGTGGTPSIITIQGKNITIGTASVAGNKVSVN